MDEAAQSGARAQRACEELGISVRTLERWRKDGGGDDMRSGPKTEPANKLNARERKRVLEVVNRPDLADLTPNEIVPKLADEGTYLCSQATMYRISSPCVS